MIRHAMASLALVACALGAAAAWAASPPAVEAPDGMVVSSQHLASDAGAEILRAGGNAVDAAVATGYAQAVTNPCCANIGGGGFMVIHLAKDDRDTFLNFRETAPAAATKAMYLDAAGNPVKGASLYGYLAVGVPGSVLGLDTALQRYGTLPREQVMAPAIKLAREGFTLTRGDTDILDAGAKLLKQDPVAAKIFFRPDGSAFKPGDRLVQADLADTLEAIAKGGPDAFYKGAVAQKVEAAMKAGGGIMTAQDFAAYTVTETAPVTCSYRGYEFVSSPPPSSGGTTMCEILNILEGYDLKALGWHSAAGVHLMVEAMRHAYMDRNTYLGDPAFVNNPLDRLLSKDYAAQIRTRILPDKATPSKEVQPGATPHEKTETTHYSVVDKDGNAVSVTYTINGLFGAGVIAPGTGFLLNDEMDDFTIKPGVPNLFGLVQGEANAISPGKRPLSSMAPTLVTKDGEIVLVLGSPGGARIITITLQAALNMIDFGMAPQEAVDAPRIHHQWLPDEVFAEPYALSPDTVKLLEQMGHKVTVQSPWGATELIALQPSAAAAGSTTASSGNDRAFGGKMLPGFVYGANDNRRPAGLAVGE
ncbi:gamma-glutamyltransferase [Mycobacterium sp. KBS0706]|uniref:gamma-glutamyltransferase n=1 Tax=Mycobacterium sp. KBS0706 TaxID=2578109 RepID=UPI00110F96DF|nr:gamma-glutamyltransferase [Mycobacterium sp. KBS0706]TSD84834.1 gamma-glutamyltransferase [Mycobacterium sp. KBS0706]